MTHHPIHRRRGAVLSTALLTGALLAVAGCGQTDTATPRSPATTTGSPATTTGSPATTPGSSATTPGSSATTPARPCLSEGPAGRVTVTESDNGATVCAAPGSPVEVYLHGTAQDRWSPLVLTGTALRRVPSGKGALAIGVTAGFFAGGAPGTGQLSAYRAPCTGPAAAGPDCDRAHVFKVTVVVR